MVEYVGILICWYVACSHVPTFLYIKLTIWLNYPSSHGFTSFIESTTSRISSFSNYNTDNTKSVTLAPSLLVLSLKVQFILKSKIRGILLSELIWQLISLIPPIRSLASKRATYYFKLMAVILLLGEIIPTYFYYMEKGLVYIIIIALFSCQPSSYIECTKLNICLFCNVYLVSNAKYIFFARLYIF